MAAKKPKRIKHIPQRTCVGCRAVLPKRNLIRIVRGQDGVSIDPTGKLAGRGAYLHDVKACWSKGLKGSLAKALRTTLTEQEIEVLKNFMATLKEEADFDISPITDEKPGKDA